MEKFICYYKFHNGVLNVSYNSARDLLLKHLNKNRINYYCDGEDGNSIQLYYQLRNTGFRIQQNIFVGIGTYRCTTSIAEHPVDSAEKQLSLLTWVCSTNKKLWRNKFVYDHGDRQLQYVNRMSLHPKNGIVSLQHISDRFDELIGNPHYLLDIEYADFLLTVLNKNI